MAGTIEKRIYITPSPVAGPVLRDLGKLTGKPPATIVRELLDEALPALQETVAALRLVKKRPEEAIAAFQRMAAKAHSDLAQLQLDMTAPQGKKPGRKPAKKAAKKISRTRRGPSSG